MRSKLAWGSLLLLVPLVLASNARVVSAAQTYATTNGSLNSGSHSVSYDHWSVVMVIETITDLGGGTWKYSYEFTNTEASSIWIVGVWTTFQTNAPFTTFTQMDPFGTWIAYSHDINVAFVEYDARNLDPNILWLSATHDTPFPASPNPIPSGAHVSGFSFTANVLNTSPKYYWYELWGSWAHQLGYVTAVGLTVPTLQVIPEVPFGTVMSFVSMCIALVGFMGFKRFRPKFRPQ